MLLPSNATFADSRDQYMNTSWGVIFSAHHSLQLENTPNCHQLINGYTNFNIIHTVEYWSVIKREGFLIHAWVSKTYCAEEVRKHKFFMILFAQNSSKGTATTERKWVNEIYTSIYIYFAWGRVGARVVVVYKGAWGNFLAPQKCSIFLVEVKRTHSFVKTHWAEHWRWVNFF